MIHALFTTTGRGPVLPCLVAAVLGLGSVWLSGCRRSQSPPAEQQTPDRGVLKPPAEQPSAEQPPTAEDILEAVVAAYKKASSYADSGMVRLKAEQAEGELDERFDFSIALERGAKLRARVYRAEVVCNDGKLSATIAELPGQVLVKDVPPELTLKSIYSDRMLAAALSGGLPGTPPQLTLLLAEDPLKMLLRGVEQTTLAEPGTIDQRGCYRLRLSRRDGAVIYWIDRETYVVRRIEFPTGQLRRMFARSVQVGDVSLVAELTGARFDAPIEASRFQFDMPAGAAQVKFFVPPSPAQLLGKKVPDFNFTNLDGNPVTPASIAGKITILDFWATWCSPCRRSLPVLSKVMERYKDNNGIAALAVSVDGSAVGNQELVDAFSEWGVNLPVARDPAGNSRSLFHSSGIPATFIIGADGIVQDFEIGAKPDLETVLPEKLDKLLAKEDLYREPLAEYNKQLEAYERALEASKAGSPEGPRAEEVKIPEAEIAPRSQPKTFKLAPLWKCDELKAPGNILVVEQPDGSPRLLVVDAWKSIAEVGTDGKLLATHQLDIDRMEVVSTLRTAAGADGKRYYAAVAAAQQRFHLFDAQFNRLLSFPKDALTNPHQGIADVELADLDGDGAAEACVGYWGVVGVQAVSFQGKRLWSNRSVTNVEKIAVAGPDPQGRRALLCTNFGSLAKIDADGKRQGEIAVGNLMLRWVVAADLTGDGQLNWCGMAAMKLGENIAAGFNLQGDQLWTCTLANGVQRQPIEPIIVGRLAPVAQRQWLLPGPDGSIHIVTAEGKQLDRFNYGAVLCGLATIELDGRPVLIVSSASGLEAWRVE